MATQQSSKLKDKAKKLIGQYEQRLGEIECIDININEVSLREMGDLRGGFEQEMKTLDSKKSAILPEGTRVALRKRYQMIIKQYRDIVN